MPRLSPSHTHCFPHSPPLPLPISLTETEAGTQSSAREKETGKEISVDLIFDSHRSSHAHWERFIFLKSTTIERHRIHPKVVCAKRIFDAFGIVVKLITQSSELLLTQ